MDTSNPAHPTPGAPIPMSNSRAALSGSRSWDDVAPMDIADPPAELDRWFKGGGSLDRHERPADIVYKLQELDVHVRVL
jgi:hypothetical protein